MWMASWTAPSRRNGAEIPESGLQRNQASEPPGAKHAGRSCPQDQGIPPEKWCADVAECLGQVLITFEQKINDKHLDVAVNFPEYSVYAQGELDAITQVAYNLIDNAVKFCLLAASWV